MNVELRHVCMCVCVCVCGGGGGLWGSSGKMDYDTILA